MSLGVEKVANYLSDLDENDCEDGYPCMNKEEFIRYHSAALKSDSQRFDVPYFPKTLAIGLIEPIMSRVCAKQLRNMAEAAIDHYNNPNGCNYEIVKIKKANLRVCRSIMYYITFYVKPADLDHPTTTFQAQVLKGILHELLKIFICRPEPEEHKDLNSLGVLVEDLN